MNSKCYTEKEKEEIITNALLTLREAVNLAMHAEKVNTDIFNSALNIWIEYIKKDGKAIHRCIHVPMSTLFVCKRYKSIAILKLNIIEYHKKSITANYKNIFPEIIDEYSEMTINFATKIYQSIYNKEI